MANTKIRLRSSGVTGNIPSSLQFGELALNYADGKLFFKRANNQISSIDLDLVGIQSDSFATINSNSTLILATSPTDTLSIVAGNNVSISTNSSSKTITINALSDDIDQIVRDIANTAASNTVYTQGVDASQNTRINAAFAAANVGNSFVNSGGTVTGNVTITGSLTVGDDFIIEGNTTYTNTNSLQIDNPIIFLANNNVLGDTFDIGFVGLYNNGANSYTGLFRDPNLDEYFLFRDYTQTIQANTLININDASFIKANLIAGYIKANLISETATVAGVNILDFLNQISSNTVYTQGVDVAQNTRIDSAYAAANVGNNFVNTGGTVGGDVTITQDLVIGGNLTVLGTEVTLNTASIDIDASLLLLANNNTLSDVIDFGFVGTYNDGVVRRAGLFRDPNLKEFLFFDGYTPGITSNTLINLNDSSFSRANIQADYFKGNLIATSVVVNGINLTDKLDSLTSNTIYTQGVDTWQNTRITAIDSYASSAYAQANAANNLAQSAFNKANNSVDQYGRDTANSASSNTVYTQGVDTTQNTRITAVDSYASGAYTQANAANNLAQSAFNKANTAAADITVIQGVDTTQNTRIQAAFDKANNASPMLKVASINSSNVYSNIVSNVSTIAFDSFTGFHVDDMGGGNVKISLGSTFSTWNVVGQSDLNAVGDDIIRINGANGIVITTNSSDSPYKSITFNGKTIFDKANSAYNMAEAADILASKLAAVNLTQNTSIQSSFDKANSANVLAQAAFDKANTGTSVSLGGFAANNVLTVNSAGYIANNTNLNYYNSNNTLVVTGNIIAGGVRTTSSTTPPENAIVGDFWYKTDNDVLYRYTSDGTSAYWLDISGSSFTGSQLQINMISPFLMMGA
jgi:cytoskeletal protein CcmA (bactofilin family)